MTLLARKKRSRHAVAYAVTVWDATWRLEQTITRERDPVPLAVMSPS
ncbi:MAG: hypothetical protein M3N13_04505 [Candidatus Eremiobacteraeota bacterium]|nr:hypothetical protein [Candidatus Eremiobacteraeota bacterium]